MERIPVSPHINQNRRLCEASDQYLVDLARGGSSEAFEAIVLRYRQPLLRHCRRLVPPAEAEDAVQDALLTAYRSLERTTAELRLGAWLFRIAHNEALGLRRRHAASVAAGAGTGHAESAHDAVMRRERMRSTLTAMSALPEAQRRVLVEREFAGRGHREIAARLGRSEAAVRQLLNRARTQLRDRAAAVAPLLVRLLPAAGEQPVVAGPIVARAGAVIAVAVAAVGGGAAILARVPGGSQSARTVHTGLRGASGPAAGSGVVQGTQVLTDRTSGQGASTRTSALAGPTGRGVSGAGPTRITAAGPQAPGSPTTRTPTPGSASSVLVNQGGTAAQPGTTGTGGTTRSAPSPTGSVVSAPAPPDIRPAPGQSKPPPPSGSTSGQSGANPGQSSGSAPGQPGSNPGHSGSAPGQSGSAPGHSGSAPGQSGSAPGQSGSNPGHSGSPPGQSGSNPGQSGSAPGQSGSAPGQSASAPPGH